ncbi:MAG: hypothetical protein Alpg2KO_17120 [Alphaproteobacteria bacterium]
MAEKLTYQIRIYLTDSAAERARKGRSFGLRQLNRILKKNGAVIKCQYDAFADYVKEAEKNGTDKYPLYKWTKATVDDEAKKARYTKAFTIYVDGQETYAKEHADALEAAIRPLVGGRIVTRMTKHDSDPKNNPQAPKHLRPPKP